jgi:cytochrome d ubiquinol oxidase subunit II
MDLPTLWYALIAVLFLGYFILEGFDFGVGVLSPFLSKEDQERRIIINSIGPHWDANEVWLITAGGAMFAAFPHWYATLFSGFYIPLFLLLTALIGRGVAFEFRGKGEHASWRTTWDWLLFLGSVIPPLLLGIAMANIVRGVPIDASMTYVGGFWNLLNPFALLCGVLTLALFTFHGANFLSLKTAGMIAQRAQRAAGWLWIPALGIACVVGVWGWVSLGGSSAMAGIAALMLGSALAATLGSGLANSRARNGWGFALSSGAIALFTLALFIALFPRLMVSSLDPAWSLTIGSASASPYTLKVMSVVALVFIPVVLLYQGWSYHVFRERIGGESKLEY